MLLIKGWGREMSSERGELEQVEPHCLVGWGGGEAAGPQGSPFLLGPAWTPPLQPTQRRGRPTHGVGGEDGTKKREGPLCFGIALTWQTGPAPQGPNSQTPESKLFGGRDRTPKWRDK